jgi:hypothetical protein
VLDLYQPLVDWYVLIFAASDLSLNVQPPFACRLPLSPGLLIVSVVWRSFSERVVVLAIVIF